MMVNKIKKKWLEHKDKLNESIVLFWYILPAEAVALQDLFVKAAASYYFSENKIQQ